MRYWIDADAFISAHRGPYPVRNARGFWGWMDKEIMAGVIVSAEMVYKEVVEGRDKKDDLAQWMELRKANGLCHKPTRAVDGRAREIGDYVNSNPQYPIHQKLEYFKGADSWIIAHAWVDNGTVVSNESGNFPNAQRVRIPDICHKFNVRHITRDQLIKELDAHF
jgi:hypothetical protein